MLAINSTIPHFLSLWILMLDDAQDSVSLADNLIDFSHTSTKQDLFDFAEARLLLPPVSSNLQGVEA
jgi:hypothetical protein